MFVRISEPTRSRATLASRFLAALLVAAPGCAPSRAARVPQGSTEESQHSAAISAVANAPAPRMRVHFIDVGQGACTLFEFPRGAVLVDTGGELNDRFDCSARLRDYLDAFFEQRPDLGRSLSSLILTHPHLDHTRNVAMVVERYAPKNVVTNGQTAGSGGNEQKWLQDYAASHRDGPNAVGFRAIRRDDVPPGGLTDNVIDPVSGPDVDPRLSVLWGQVASDPGWGMDRGRLQFDNANNHCVVVRVEFGATAAIVTGDLQDVAIHDLVALHRDTGALRAAIYEVGHHGSINGTTEELLAAMNPKFAVLEVGDPARQSDYTAWAFGHPRREIVSMLEGAVATPRDSLGIRVGVRSKEFEPRTMAKAIYATGWDGNVVLEGTADGEVTVLAPAGPRATVTAR